MIEIPILRPVLPTLEQIAPYIEKIDASHVYTNYGPLVRIFESRLAARYGLAAASVTTVCSATAGLTLALQGQGCRPGSYCILPAWTFVASPLAVLAAGLLPYFIDVDLAAWTIDPERVEAALGDVPGRVGAIMPVAPFGSPLPVGDWDAFRTRHGIPVVIDAAAAFDAQKPGDVPCVISLHATKALGIGEGGLVVARDADLIARLRALTNFGFLGERVARVPGQNAKLSEYHAAVGLAALDRWDEQRASIASLAARYGAALADSPIRLQAGFGRGWVALTCIADLPGETQETVEASLRAAGVETRRWWGSGAHAHPVTRAFPHANLPHTERLARTSIGLPFHRFLADVQIETIARLATEAVRAAMRSKGHSAPVSAAAAWIGGGRPR